MTLTRLLDARRGPTELVLVRHGESLGNLADADARRRGAERLELTERDADIELSDNGRGQADGLNRWLLGAAEEERPQVVLSSPYRRAAETAERALRDLALEVRYDERLRERDLGVFDGLTSTGIRAAYPEEAQRRRKVGKFYYQPPSGESWSDVVLRIRSMLADVREALDEQRVWVFTHQAVIMTFRYVLEGLDERELLRLDADVRVGNASLTRYRRGPDGMALTTFADTRAAEATAEVTHEEPQAGRGDDAHAGRGRGGGADGAA